MSTLPAPAPVGIHRFVTRAVPLTSSVVTGVVVPIPTSPEVVTWKNEFNGIRRPSVGTELAERHTSPWNDVSRIALLHALVVAETGIPGRWQVGRQWRQTAQLPRQLDRWRNLVRRGMTPRTDLAEAAVGVLQHERSLQGGQQQVGASVSVGIEPPRVEGPLRRRSVGGEDLLEDSALVLAQQAAAPGVGSEEEVEQSVAVVVRPGSLMGLVSQGGQATGERDVLELGVVEVAQ